MGSNQDVGSRFKTAQRVSFSGMGFPDEKSISDIQTQVNDSSFSNAQAMDGTLSYKQGMNHVVDHTSEAFWRMDHEFKFTYTNAACEKVSGGYTSEDLMGKSLLEFVAPDSLARLQHVHGGRRRDEMQGIKTDVIYYELQMRRKDGTYFWAGISASPIRDIGGNIIGYQGVLKDVSDFRKYETENRRLEGLLKQKEKQAVLGQMAGTVAHEVNNVMAGILGFSELLMLQTNADNDVNGEHIRNIIGFSERIIAILQDVMMLARKDDEARKSLNLNELIPVLLRKPELQKLTGQPACVAVSLDLEPSLHDILVLYSSFEKALMNLLAVSFMQAGQEGIVSISTKTVYLGHPGFGDENVREGEYVVLSVSDNGNGISEDNAGRIFEPFYLRKVMKTQATGLELTTAREVIKELNGFIDIRSKIGVGSTFTVYLPVLSGRMQATPYVVSQVDDPEEQTGIH